MTRLDDGYRREPLGGPRVRADVIEVYVIRASGRAHEFLQVLRASDPLRGTWHPVMGHTEPGETASETALRELEEEIGLSRADPALLDMFALEQVHPYYLAALDCIVMSPRFVALVAPAWEPRLNDEHESHRWIDAGRAKRDFLWPGQKRAAEEIVAEILNSDAPARRHLRISLKP